ncbi:MAG: Cof-type HAD-IIB family hydrolase [Candidatus Brocadiia bacterium]
MAPYRLIAVDIDGTLLDSAAVLRPSVCRALRRAVAAGLHVVLCTGRRYRTAYPIAQEMDLPLPLICHSGALAKDTATHRTLFSLPIPRADVGVLLDALSDFGLTPLVYSDSFDSGTDFYVERGAALTPYHQDYLAKNAGNFAVVESLACDVPQPILQVCTFAERRELEALRPRLRERLAGRTTCHLLSSAKYLGDFLEFQAAGASKWGALLTIAEARGIGPSAIAAIGDDENDVSMLRDAGLGVAMGNAPYEVKGAADVVTAGNDEDGVVRVVDKLLEARQG